MMVEQGMGGDKLAVQPNYHPYPPPLATYEDVVGSRDLFMDTLKKFHASMGTKFMIPIVGGRDLDLHRLFVEVTSRGGISKVLKDKKWKEVTSVFSFPSSATNASFILRKYYVSLLYHYEQTYLFKAKCWTPSPSDTMQHLSTITATHGSSEFVPSVTQQTHAAANTATSMPQESLEPSAVSPVCGVIDGKFDSGYLITVKIGSEEFKGVLYQVPSNDQTQIFPNPESTAFLNLSPVKPRAPRRKRRKKSEIRKRDPAHPKPNRSGYNFFFAEQHARLKPLYHGKDRVISRIIGQTWNILKEPGRAVYQEKALKDKERYKIEMEDYRKRLRTGQISRSTLPIQPPHPLVPVINLVDLNSNLQFESATSAYPQDNEMGSDKSDKSSSEEYESADKESDFGECSQADAELKNVNIEIMADDETFDLQTRPDKVDKSSVRDAMHENDMLTTSNNDLVPGEDGISVPVEEIEQPLSNNADESVPSL